MENIMKTNRMKYYTKNKYMGNYMRKNMKNEMKKTISDQIYFILYFISERVLVDRLIVIAYLL